VPLVLPMLIKGRVEVVVFLGLTVWLHVGCGAEWWFVGRRLREAWGEWVGGRG
jgi:type IV secretory pathway TrbD component